MSAVPRAQRKVSRKRARKGAGSKVYNRKKTTSSVGRTAAYERNLGPKERKNIDTNVATVVAGNMTGLALSPLACINTSVAGALAAGQRIGRNIMMRSILVRGTVVAPAAMTGSAFFRYLVVYDRESNGSLPTALLILNSDEITSAANLGNARRFKVLADFKHPLAIEDSASGIQFERYIKCNLPVRYVDGLGAGTYVDIVEGAVWVMTYLGGVSVTASPPLLTMKTRVRYDDC